MNKGNCSDNHLSLRDDTKSKTLPGNELKEKVCIFIDHVSTFQDHAQSLNLQVASRNGSNNLKKQS